MLNRIQIIQDHLSKTSENQSSDYKRVQQPSLVTAILPGIKNACRCMASVFIVLKIIQGLLTPGNY